MCKFLKQAFIFLCCYLFGAILSFLYFFVLYLINYIILLMDMVKQEQKYFYIIF